MKDHNRLRRGVALGVATLTGLSAAVAGGVGVADPAAMTAHRNIALVADPTTPVEAAHMALVQAQADQNTSYFDSQVVALQQSIYYWALQNNFESLLFPGNADDPATSLFNGAFTRFSEANEVSQAMMQVQWDHLLGVNQSLGEGGYETAIAASLYDDFAGSGIDPTSALGLALAEFAPDQDFTSFSGFVSDLATLQSALLSTAFSDMLGMFFVGM